ncbi:hypothetical protein AAVH_29140 [Aphelenchoides avenae]|nr:hypothetical protein AAVH_29140 [Aphelenchus avenae]
MRPALAVASAVPTAADLSLYQTQGWQGQCWNPTRTVSLDREERKEHYGLNEATEEVATARPLPPPPPPESTVFGRHAGRSRSAPPPMRTRRSTHLLRDQDLKDGRGAEEKSYVDDTDE